MEESGRNYLTGTIMLSRNEDGSSPEEYFIKSVIGEGGSTVCYEATRTLKDGVVETGKLKEFYPVDSVVGNQAWYYSLERLPNGQLVPGTGTIRKFDEMCKDYLSTYKLLRKVMVDNPKNEILKSYIQHGEILYGCTGRAQPASQKIKSPFTFLKKRNTEGVEVQDDRKSTVYIWSPGVPGKGFDVYLSEIRKKPTLRSEARLKDILYVMNALTDCIKALHTAGLMHMDIKPSNFLVQYDSDFEIKPNNISLFDINTLCSVDSEFIRVSGTEGFCAPEVAKGKADNRSDIYSIGAMLFNAVVITKDIPDGLYRDFYYSSINQLVKHSSLFISSETNSDAALMSRICRILEKCLAKEPKKRYQSCTELKADLDKAILRLTKMLWTPVKKNHVGISEPTIVIQKLLYEHPLYEAVSSEVSDVNVLVIGSGTYGQKFIDICLQSGQMSGTQLNITAVSDAPEDDKEAYLRFRPALKDFVNIDGSLQGRNELAYASLEFHAVSETTEGVDESLRFTNKPSQLNKDIVENLIMNAVMANKDYRYVFVALGNDTISHSIARLCAEQLGYSCPVCYVSQKVKRARRVDLDNKLYPVCINEPVDVAAIDQRLGEMAFNTHISWNGSLNMDVTAERNKFFSSEDEKDRYNRTSSLAYALSIKYKLHSVHIECEDLLEAANLFSKQILALKGTDSDAKKKFDQLVDLEHRRWLLERAVDGWTAPRDENGRLKLEDSIMRGSVKDTQNRTHPCMVRGSETSPLSSSEYTANDYAKWDEGEIDPKLDDLDRMSLELHRCFKNQADKVRKESLYQNPDMAFIQNLIPNDNDEAQKAFKQFQFALKNIINGVESYSRQYDYYQDALKMAIAGIPLDVKGKIEERLAVIKHAFFPVIESNLYCNYKAFDEVLVKKIPFILTYSYVPAVAMAFEDGKYQNGRNEAIFANVASATVLSPEKIYYLYCYNRASSIELLIRKLDSVLNYYGKRKVHCGIELVIACLSEVSDKELTRIQKELNKLKKQYQKDAGNAWLDEEHIIPVDGYEQAADELIKFMCDKNVQMLDGSTRIFPSEYDNAMFIGKVTGQKIAYFEFDWRNKTFTKHIGCDFLKYVKDSSFIRIQDMFALMNATDNQFNLPEFADDYEELWKIYTGEYLNFKKFENGVGNWNCMCMCLEKYESDQKPLAKIALSTNANPTYKTLTYFLPEYSFSTVKKLLQKLVEYGIAQSETSIVNHTSDTCKVELKVNSEYEQQVNEVFIHPQMLLPYYGLEVRKYKSYNADYVEIRYNNLTVTDASLEQDGGNRHKFAFGVLKQLENAHFISQLKASPSESDPKQVSFVYSSPRIKKLLTSAGEILEVYAYYDVLKTGYFDDVASSYEFNWESGGVKNELDLVLTKGFRSIIVECKAVVELKLDYYHKLHSIADQFGIGTIKVLLGNTYARSNVVANDLNTMQRSRGTQLSIKTISSEDQIINIGQTLVKLMEKD